MIKLLKEINFINRNYLNMRIKSKKLGEGSVDINEHELFTKNHVDLINELKKEISVQQLSLKYSPSF